LMSYKKKLSLIIKFRMLQSNYQKARLKKQVDILG
jgi:hypothetical protein